MKRLIGFTMMVFAVYCLLIVVTLAIGYSITHEYRYQLSSTSGDNMPTVHH